MAATDRGTATAPFQPKNSGHRCLDGDETRDLNSFFLSFRKFSDIQSSHHFLPLPVLKFALIELPRTCQHAVSFNTNDFTE